MKINLIEFFEETYDKCPEKVAVVDGKRSITFGDLAKKAKSLAAFIIQEEHCKNRPVAVYLPKCIETVYSDLAITYSGNAYMNLDVKTPAARIGNILSLIQPQAVITDTKHIEALKPSCPESLSIINVDELPDRDDYDISVLDSIIDTDPYCIINTSGSTGTPKGVVLNHRSFFDFVDRSLEAFNITDNEILGSLSPVVFDIYVLELCLLMRKSSTMVLIPESLSAFPASILKILSEQQVSFLFWVPTIMVNIANMELLGEFDLSSLRTVWFAGEVFPTKQFNIWRRNLPQVTFANLYGPIEITLDCVFYIVKRELKDEEPIPIGYPYRNTDILILDDTDKLITDSEVEGELCVRGTSLAMGYYNNPEKTAAAFVQNPLNHSYPEIIYRTGDIVCINQLSEIVFKGRKDNIVKHSGYRTDLGEIEHVIINTLKLVKNGCIVYNFQKKEITLFYEAEDEISPSDFRKKIGIELPRYMIPSVYHRLEQLKRNTNGKIDRLYYKNLVNE
jgi:amino acid adenylation domain-containing protein